MKIVGEFVFFPNFIFASLFHNNLLSSFNLLLKFVNSTRIFYLQALQRSRKGSSVKTFWKQCNPMQGSIFKQSYVLLGIKQLLGTKVSENRIKSSLACYRLQGYMTSCVITISFLFLAIT